MEPHQLVNTESVKLKHKNRLLAKVAGGYPALANNPEKAVQIYKDVVDFAKQDKNLNANKKIRSCTLDQNKIIQNIVQYSVYIS
jgi:hypothetical protein